MKAISLFAQALVIATMIGNAVGQQATAAEEITRDGVVTGTIDINFGTRVDVDEDGNPNKGATDTYKVNLTILDITEIRGNIYRKPRIKSWGLTQQDAGLRFDLDYFTKNPAKLTDPAKASGKFAGVVPMDINVGTYSLDGSKDAPLKLDCSLLPNGKVDFFRGIIQGKAADKESLKEMVLKFTTGGTGKAFTIKKADPLYFQNITLASGPYGYLIPATVSGPLVYNYDSGSYLTNNLTFSYGSKEDSDKIQGTIAWVQDADYANNGKSHYDFNLKFNEDRTGPKTDEAAVFAPADDESAIFAVDTSVPSLTGTVSFVDEGTREEVEGEVEITPSHSLVTFNLHANKLTKRQIHSFIKLWLLITGPVNDE